MLDLKIPHRFWVLILLPIFPLGSCSLRLQKFAAWGDLIKFQKLNIESDPLEQSFDEGSYDLIIASAVLPGGKPIMLEITQDRLDAQLVFGTLPGWWLSEEPDRKMKCTIFYLRLLRATGFTGIDVEIGDCEEPSFQSTSIIVATAETPREYILPISIIHTDSPPQECLTQITAPFVGNLDKRSFDKLRNLRMNCKAVVRLSRGGIIDAKAPLFSATQGLLRTARLEDSSKRCIHLDFDSSMEFPWSGDDITHIMHVLRETLNSTVEDNSRDIMVGKAPADTTPQLQRFHQPDRVLEWEPSRAGVHDDLYFTDSLGFAKAIPDGMVDIQTKAFGLVFRDVMSALGQVDDSLLGHECSGIVKQLGPNTEKCGLKVGDRVSALRSGRFAKTGKNVLDKCGQNPR
ncbi:hypothetical protein V8C42DRAFT_356758 [Trichoderma barbatum]